MPLLHDPKTERAALGALFMDSSLLIQALPGIKQEFDPDSRVIVMIIDFMRRTERLPLTATIDDIIEQSIPADQ